MTVTVRIHPDGRLFLEVPDNTEEILVENNSRLSVNERMALLDELADKFMKLVGSDFPPLSDYAMSRESIYEDHLRHKPKENIS